MDSSSIESKWKKRWDEAKLFEAEAHPGQPKFFLTFPYPYMNGFMHLGHFYTLMRVEAFARFKRMKGFNVLFPQGWHCTGSPIESAAKRVQENEPKQIKILKDMGFNDQDIKKFADPEHWVNFFPKEAMEDYKSVGMSVDFRRSFITTSLNPHYDKFIRWQFNKLKEKNYVVKGKHPVVWCPKCNGPVPDHSRMEGEGETPQEYLLFRHKLDDGRYLISATLRPDTVLGVTNLYVNPDADYIEADVNGETWILGEPAAERLKDQEYKVTVKKKVRGLEFIGKKTEEFGSIKVPILPAAFLDPKFGTGLVHSVPSDSADDLIALWDLQKDDATIKRYNLNPEEIRAIRPIPILNTPGFGDIAAEAMLKKYNITSQNQRSELEKIKKELYKLSHFTATLNSRYKTGFRKDLEGLKVEEAKEIITEELIEKGYASKYYELTGKVICRCLTPAIVKIVSDQWFLDYADPGWKKQVHGAFRDIKLYPDKSRPQFEYVIDWLAPWACTREFGLGTRLPWDDKWVIESLSDSTIYMAYYTISHILKDIPIDKINDKVFDYIFLDKGHKPDVDNIEMMKSEFQYWYPLDFRNSGKDLIQNHLTFFVFNHTAIFDKKYWPGGIGTNGWVTVDGQKMSKSLGNFILLRDLPKKFGVDASRITVLSGGEGLDDANFDSEMAFSVKSKLENLFNFLAENYDKGRDETLSVDFWFESTISRIIRDSELLMDETLFRSALQKIFFEMPNILKWYQRRSKEPNRRLMNRYIESQLMMLAPFAPFFCEEVWEKIGRKPFISVAEWPKPGSVDDSLDHMESMIETTLADIRQVQKLAKIDQPKRIQLFISAAWKYDLFLLVKKNLSDTKNPKDIIGAVMQTELKRYSKDIMKIIPKLIQKAPEHVFSQDEELKYLQSSADFFKEEFGAEVSIIKAEDSKENKAAQASPGKPAILIE
ncbi:leucine--tRNA ligase [Candidatus Woesearchaeota archaeon]|nr:leucine--tRNA ligase [Candidatus Woesearchaeota archaeon]